MTASKAMLVPLGRALLSALEAAAPAARTLADRGLGARDLSELLRRAIKQVAGAEIFFEAPARRDLLAIDPSIGAQLERFFRAPWADEAAARAEMAKATVMRGAISESLSMAMRAYRASDGTVRAGARAGIEVTLEKLGREGALGRLRERIAERQAARSASAASGEGRALAREAEPSRGLIFTPSAELIASLSADPASVHALGLAIGDDAWLGAASTSGAAAGAFAEPGAERASSAAGTPSASSEPEPGTPSASSEPEPGTPSASSEPESGTPSASSEPESGTPSASSEPEPNTAAASSEPKSGTASGSRSEATGGSAAEGRFSFSWDASSARSVVSGGVASGGSPAEPPAPARLLQDSLRDLVHSIAEDGRGRTPSDFGALRAARAGFDVADFRPSPDLALLRGLERFAPLPFEQPLAPIARPGAGTEPDLDASSTVAYLIAAGELAAGRALGAALALTSATRAFIEKGFADRPSDRSRARRALALELLVAYVDSTISVQAAGDPDALRDAYQDTLGCAPPHGIAISWTLEEGLSLMPGESRALYARSTSFRAAILSGVTAARELRERFDEDWFRNPRASREVVRNTLASPPEASEADLVRWLQDCTS